jgi:hypothetical protein
MFGPLIAWLARAVGAVLGFGTLATIAIKGFMILLFTIVLPIVLAKVIYGGAPVLIEFILSMLDGMDMQATVLNLTGPSAWLATKLRLIDCVSLLISAVVARITLKFASKAIIPTVS